jgi:pyruvate formate-lyase activating enzyme-like uncharacterized protein
MADALYREKCINANRREYGRAYDLLHFADDVAIAAANLEREALLAWLGSHARFGYADTKVDCSRLAPGCLRCGEGSWSCLFINGRCNGRCFYCPTSQDDDGPPVTNGLVFAAPEEYADYVQWFGFRGVSISGGEPLLTPQLTLAYLRAVRQRCGDDLHLWLYTNGTLLTKELCKELREAGLDEIRFDLGAVRYNLKKLRLAVGVIPAVTVEIPAVPEDELVMQRTMRELAEAGCNHLNLHQLRLTPHNLPQLLERNYTFVHGEKLTVLESELAALRLVRYSIEEGLGLPVNYCSFPYKRRFQHAAARRRAALSVCGPGEQITDCGYLRVLGQGTVQYSEAAILQAPTMRGPFEKIMLPGGRPLYLERQPVTPQLSLPEQEAAGLVAGATPERLLAWESIARGLAPYF